MLKVLITFLTILFCILNLDAQADNNIKLKLDAGLLWDWVDGKIYLSGPFFCVEPKLKTSIKSTIGLRMLAAHNTQRIISTDANQFSIDNDNGNGNGNGVFSLTPTFNYTLIKNKYQPYLGIGIGYYFLTTSKEVLVIAGPPNNTLGLNVENQIGLLLRAGSNLCKLKVGRTDLSKFTIGIELNYVPKTDVKTSNGERVGTIVTSNIGLSLGYTIGNGKRGQRN